MPDLQQWFRILVRNKMAGLAAPVCGLSIGFAFLQSVRFTPAPYGFHVGLIGLLILYSSAVIFVGALLAYAASAVRREWKRKR